MKTIIGVMGPGHGATQVNLDAAYQLGQLIAQQDWVLLTGGRNSGVMAAASRGAKAGGGLTVGILPDAHTAGVAPGVDIAIVTDLGNARNNINVLSSRVVIACGTGIGTTSEVALALKNGKPVVLLQQDSQGEAFFNHLGGKQLFLASDPQAAIARCQELLSQKR